MMNPDLAEFRIGLVLFVVLFISYACFTQGPLNWNIVSRIATSINIVETGSMELGEFSGFTHDRALVDGKYYSDKAPGMTIMALPVVWTTVRIMRAQGHEHRWVGRRGLTRSYRLTTYLGTVFTSGLITALAALTLYFLALRLGAGLPGALFAALTLGLATPVWGWATAFFGHVSAGSFLLFGFAAVTWLLRSPVSPRRDLILGFAAGAALTWAVVVEYTAAPAAAVIALYGLWEARRWERKRILRVLGAAAAGGAVFITPLLVYNRLAFGSALKVGYQNTDGFEGLKEGIFGITYPKPYVLYAILFSPFRGIFWVTPILLAAPLALHRFWKGEGTRAAAVAVTLVALCYLLVNTSYAYWSGGWSTGPRHLTPLLPLLCLSFAWLWREAGSRGKALLTGLFILSAGLSLICVSVDMASPEHLRWPLFQHIIPGFIRGRLRSPLVLLGIRGKAALLPLVAAWVTGAFLVRREFKNSAPSPRATGGEADDKKPVQMKGLP